MGERRALVIGAPNDRFGRLTFLPEVVRDLHRVVRDPQRGGCQPALPDGRDLLLGAAATHRKIVAAIKDAMAAANRDQATLFVYFCGHGVRKAEDFFLIGSDTRPDDVDLDTAFGLGYRLTGLLQSHPTLDGVMFLLDACHSGEVVANPVHGLFSAAMQGRIEFLTATRAEQVASKGCFSRSLTQLLTVGSPRTADPELLAYREHARLSQVPPAPSECRGMAKAVHLSLNGTSDAGLWLGRNPAADLRPALHGTTGADLVAQLTRDWQRRLGPLGSLATLLSSEISPIAITGGPATGKSALLAGLGRRSADDWGMGLDALVSVRPGGTLVQLADELADQLSRTEAYRSGKQRWQQATPITDQDAAPEFQRLITGPLAHLRPGDRIRIGIDAADQLDTVQRRRLIDAAADLPQVILLLTGRRLDEVSPTSRVELPDTDPDAVARLLVTLIDEPETRCQVTTLAGGEWLLSRILAGLWRAGQLRPGTAQLNLTDLPAAFDAAIATAQTAALQAPIDDVLRLLAAAPTGTWMPLNVLTAILERHAARCSATAVHPQLDATAVWARDALVALGELVARAEPGESTERLGPAHDKIATHLANRYGQAVVAASHSTIAEVLIQIIASDEAPVHVRAYATAHLSEHLHAAGRTPDALKHVPKLSTPADNLALWQVWHDRLAYQGENHLDVLTVRSSIAFWTGEVGDAAEALRLAEQLLPDQVRVLGPDHPEVLTTRHNVAFRVGEVGDAAGALRLLEQLLLDRVRVLGPDHPEVLMTRNNVAFWTGQAGDAAGALQLFEQLLPDQVRVLGPDHPDVLLNRGNIARFTGQAGDAAGALQLFEQLQLDQVRVLRPDEPDVLITRANIAVWTGEVGDAAGALRLFEQLLPDLVRVLGPDHPDALKARGHIAFWTGEVGDAAGALRLFEQLLPDRVRVLGPDHPEVLTTRHNVAFWTGQAGDAAGALRLFEQLLPDRVRVLGPDHPEVLTTRHNVAFWTGQAGDAAGALQLFEQLLPDQVRVLGPDHPDVLLNRGNIARFTGQAGDAAGALQLFEQLLPDQVRVLGPDEPDVLITRANIAVWTGEVGDAAGALRLFEQLLPDLVRVLGPDHPAVLGTRDNTALYTGRSGDERQGNSFHGPRAAVPPS